MINLFTSFFLTDNKQRQDELWNCLLNNIQCKEIDKIHLVLEYPIESQLLKHSKVKTIIIKGRPTFNVFFELVNKNSSGDDWNIISNTDIFFDSSLKFLERHNSKQCLALTRWEVKSQEIEFLNRVDSQDCWIFKGHIKNVSGGFELGKCGCDNAIAHRIYQGGYDVINPSKTIKSYHVHRSDYRTYNVNDKVPMPYKLLTPTI